MNTFRIKIYTSKTLSSIKKTIEKCENVNNIHISKQSDNVFDVTIMPRDDIIEVLKYLAEEHIVFDFCGIEINKDTDINVSLKLILKSQEIYDWCNRQRMSLIENYTHLLTGAINELSSRIDELNVNMEELNGNVCFDVASVIDEICEVLHRPDILENHISKLTIQ